MPEQLTSDTTSPMSALPVVLFQELNRYYTLQNHDSVMLFLEGHQELIPPLLDARTHIQTLFPGAEVLLDIDTLETEDDAVGQPQQLVAAIATDVDAHEAVTRLRTFDFDWWLAQSVSRTGLLLFTVE